MWGCSLQVEKTTVKKNTLTPQWNERLWMLVQEPTTQFAYITMNDVDLVNAKDLLRFNVFKGATNVFQAKELMGRSMLRVADFLDSPGEGKEVTLPLGLGEFQDEDGCVSNTVLSQFRLIFTFQGNYFVRCRVCLNTGVLHNQSSFFRSCGYSLPYTLMTINGMSCPVTCRVAAGASSSCASHSGRWTRWGATRTLVLAPSSSP